MFTIKNLRKEKDGDWTKLIVDLEVSNFKNPFKVDTIWFAIENKNADMLTDDVYDAFAPYLLYLGMFYHQDIYIKGKMSPLLYHNLTHYVMTIFDNFSKYTKPVEFKVDGFKEAKQGKLDLIGTGISCGVDSLSTLYSNFVETNDKRFKINSLFFFNNGSHGEYGDEETYKIWRNRIEIHKNVPKRLGLPSYYIDSNLHAFRADKLPGPVFIYIASVCCVLSVQRCVKRYLFANNLSYDEILEGGLGYKDKDLFEYCESYALHLFSTERLQMVIDGCEFTRAEKLARIKDWDIAQENLDVCVNPDAEGHNCSKCVKCMRTLLVLDAMGEINNFRNVFDLDVYHKMRQVGLSEHITSNNAQCNAVIKYLKQRGVFVPPKFYAVPKHFSYKFYQKVDRKLKHIKKFGTWK